MKKKLLLGTLLVTTLALTALFSVSPAEAKQNGNGTAVTSENSAFPGNSLYGRMHNKHFMYKWGNQNFENFDALVAHLRLYLKQKFQDRICTTTDCVQSTSTVNVITQTATNIDADSATLRGKIELDEDETADVWFTYGTTSAKLSSSTTKVEIAYGEEDDFTKNITDLKPETRYYYRAVAEDEDGKKDYGKILYFTTLDDGTITDVQEPVVVTRAPGDITEDTVVIRGQVEMEDFDNGVVFFVYGKNATMVNDVDEDFDTFADIDESGEDLEKIQVDADLDGVSSYDEEIENLDGNTKYYYRVGVQYENEDGEDTLKLGDARSFTTE